MRDWRSITVSVLTHLIFRYHLPLKQTWEEGPLSEVTTLLKGSTKNVRLSVSSLSFLMLLPYFSISFRCWSLVTFLGFHKTVFLSRTPVCLFSLYPYIQRSSRTMRKCQHWSFYGISIYFLAIYLQFLRMGPSNNSLTHFPFKHLDAVQNRYIIFQDSDNFTDENIIFQIFSVLSLLHILYRWSQVLKWKKQKREYVYYLTAI